MTAQYDFSGQVITITGAASGFGRLTAIRLGEAGATLSLNDVNAAGLASLASELSAQGINVLHTTCDISDNGQVRRFFANTISRFGRVDVAINNAGIGHQMLRLADLTEATFDKNIGVNLKGVFLCMKYALESMLRQGTGVIVNVSSVSGLIGSPFLSIYTAAKHGVIGLTKTAALEYGRKGIRVNAVCPSFSQTAIFDAVIEEKGTEYLEKLATHVPMQRLAEPEEVVNTILWLSSSQSSFTNGVALPVDGGVVAG